MPYYYASHYAALSRITLYRSSAHMKELGERIEDIDIAALSHAHYDHANGFPAFLGINSKAKLYVSESTAADCYAKKFIFKEYIGIPRNLMTDYADRVESVSEVYEITKGVFIVPHTSPNLDVIGKRDTGHKQ